MADAETHQEIMWRRLVVIGMMGWDRQSITFYGEITWAERALLVGELLAGFRTLQSSTWLLCDRLKTPESEWKAMNWSGWDGMGQRLHTLLYTTTCYWTTSNYPDQHNNLIEWNCVGVPLLPGGATILCHFWNRVVFRQSRGLSWYALCLDMSSCIGSRITHNCKRDHKLG